MSYTPVELRHVRVGRRPLGYDRASVEQILADVADSFETVWRDRGELADKVEALELQLDELKRREAVLTNTLVAAERAASEVRDQAKREAELIISEAHGEARAISRSGQSERERLFVETRRIETLLRSALGLVTEAREVGTVAEPVRHAAEAAAPTPAAEQSVPETLRVPEGQPVTEIVEPAEPVAEARPEPEPEAATEPKAEQREETGEPRRLNPAPSVPLDDGPVADESADAEPVEPELDDQPGWPPLRSVAGRSSHFDWGE